MNLYTESDITLIVAVRLHIGNPWVLERLRTLRLVKGYVVSILVVDYGSENEFQQRVTDACNKQHIDYLYVDDSGVFSLAEARNRGFEEVLTPLVFFTDIDFVFEKDFFSRLVYLCSALSIRERNTIIGMPAYHLGKHATDVYLATINHTERSTQLSDLSFRAVQARNGKVFEFIAPYSNNFACHRDTFWMSGGYCEEFRGHGSEDFEFFNRYLDVFGGAPNPSAPMADLYRPQGMSFYAPKDYAGFRRRKEFYIFPAELTGLKAFHLWHPLDDGSAWRKKNDRRRNLYRKVVRRYRKKRRILLDMDYLKQPREVLCVANGPHDWRYFISLRQMGYRTRLLLKEATVSADGSGNLVIARCIIGKTQQNHHDGDIIIRPGLLPGSVHYDLPQNRRANLLRPSSEEELKQTGIYLQWLIDSISKVSGGEDKEQSIGSPNAILFDSERLVKLSREYDKNDLLLFDCIGKDTFYLIMPSLQEASFSQCIRQAVQVYSAKLILSEKADLGLLAYLLGRDVYMPESAWCSTLLPPAQERLVMAGGEVWLSYPGAAYNHSQRIAVLAQLLYSIYLFADPNNSSKRYRIPSRRVPDLSYPWEENLPGAAMEKSLEFSWRSYVVARLNICRGQKCSALSAWGRQEERVNTWYDRFGSFLTKLWLGRS